MDCPYKLVVTFGDPLLKAEFSEIVMFYLIAFAALAKVEKLDEWCHSPLLCGVEIGLRSSGLPSYDTQGELLELLALPLPPYQILAR